MSRNGAKSFEKVLSFGIDWPYGEKHVVVLSSSGVQIPSELEKTTEKMSGTPADVAEILEKRGFTHLYIDGGSTIRGFLDAGLIDSLILTRVPIILGSGISLFGGLQSEVGLDHITTQSFDSGLVQSKYRVAHLFKEL